MNDMEDDIAAAMQEVSGGAADSAGGAGSTPGSTGDAGGDAPAAPAIESSPADAPDKGAPVESAAAKRARDDKGRFAPGSPEAKAAEAVAAKAAPAAVKPTAPVQAAAAAPVPPAVTPAAALKAPQSWTPAAREHFAKMPPEAQAEVNRREKEIATALQELAPARAFKEVLAPFEGQMRAEGADPVATVQSLLRTQHTLRNGSPGARAAMVAQIVKAFDVPIQALDEALAGGVQSPQQQQPQGAQPLSQEDVDRAVDQRINAARERALATQAQASLREFLATEPEFLNEVRPHAQALLQSGAAKGFQEAYDMACWASSDIRGILQQREAVKAANATTASTQQARSAASSIRSQPAGATHAPQSKTVEDDVRESWAELNGR